MADPRSGASRHSFRSTDAAVTAHPSRDLADVTLIAAAVEPYEREGTRAYDVYVGGECVGEVKRYRERYPYKSLGGNVAMFRSRWSWRNSVDRRAFDTRKEALARLLEHHITKSAAVTAAAPSTHKERDPSGA